MAAMLFGAVREIDNSITAVIFVTGPVWHAVPDEIELHRIENMTEKG